MKTTFKKLPKMQCQSMKVMSHDAELYFIHYVFAGKLIMVSYIAT